MGDGTGEIVVFEERQAKKNSGAEVDRGVDIFEIHVFDTLNRIEHARGFLRPAAVGRGADAEAGARGLRPDFPLQQQLLLAVRTGDHFGRMLSVGRF